MSYSEHRFLTGLFSTCLQASKFITSPLLGSKSAQTYPLVLFQGENSGLVTDPAAGLCGIFA